MYLWYFFTVDYNKAPTTSHSSLISEKKNCISMFWALSLEQSEGKKNLMKSLISIVFVAY